MTDPYVPDRPVVCPYNSDHIVAQSRLQRHIIKCSKNFAPNYRLCCPYNATHRLPKTELKDHVAECPDRKFVDPILYEGKKFRRSKVFVSSNRGSIANFKMEDRSVITCEESWDEEDGTLYDLNSLRDLDESMNEPIVRTNTHAPNFATPATSNIQPRTVMRAPKGLPEALLMDESGDSAVEDIESERNFTCMGRGKRIAYSDNEQYLRIVGRGRGSSPQKS